MQSILIASKNPKNAHEHAVSICKKNKIHDIDVDISVYEKAVGIADIRTIQKKLFLKPIKSGTKAVVIEANEGLTVETQNSLLKILEEPPENTIIIVTVLNKEFLLPTILSRCKIIEIKDTNKKLGKNELSTLNSQLSILFSDRVGDKMKLAQDMGNRKQEAIAWLEQLLLLLREDVISMINNKEKDSISKYLNLIKQIEKTYIIIKTTNVNQRFALENLFLSFS